jgi:hypothetical protein
MATPYRDVLAAIRARTEEGTAQSVAAAKEHAAVAADPIDGIYGRLVELEAAGGIFRREFRALVLDYQGHRVTGVAQALEPERAEALEAHTRRTKPWLHAYEQLLQAAAARDPVVAAHVAASFVEQMYREAVLVAEASAAEGVAHDTRRHRLNADRASKVSATFHGAGKPGHAAVAKLRGATFLWDAGDHRAARAAAAEAAVLADAAQDTVTAARAGSVANGEPPDPAWDLRPPIE